MVPLGRNNQQIPFIRQTNYFLITAILLLSGCSDTVNVCKEKKYKGIVLQVDITDLNIYCSNGKLSPNRKNYMTAHGEKAVLMFTYLKLNSQQNGKLIKEPK